MTTQRQIPTFSSRSAIVALAAILILAVAAFFVWRHVTRLGDRLADLDRQVEDLGGRAAAADERAVTAEERAAEAEAGAHEARRQAGAAAERAETAAARELESAEQAREAEAARLRAEEQEKQAAAARRMAEALAEESAAAREAAVREKAAVEERRAAAAAEAEAARAEAAEARAEADAVRRRMAAELDRLEGALGRIADTRRTALGLVMTLDSRQIEFDFDKAELRPKNRELLARIAGVLLTFEHYGIQVFGHTDAIGSEAYNQTLSERRAQAVRTYLVEAGIDPAALSTRGLGKSSPLVAGTDRESRQRNRRVELAIVFSEGDFAVAEEPSNES